MDLMMTLWSFVKVLMYNNCYVLNFYLLTDLGLKYSNCTDYEVKLINGSSSNEGTLQVCLNNAWGTACNKQLNTKDAGVICHQLGYPAEGRNGLKMTVIISLSSL